MMLCVYIFSKYDIKKAGFPTTKAGILYDTNNLMCADQLEYAEVKL